MKKKVEKIKWRKKIWTQGKGEINKKNKISYHFKDLDLNILSRSFIIELRIFYQSSIQYLFLPFVIPQLYALFITINSSAFLFLTLCFLHFLPPSFPLYFTLFSHVLHLASSLPLFENLVPYSSQFLSLFLSLSLSLSLCSTLETI